MDKKLENTIKKLVKRIVESVQPEKIVLFGSASQGTSNLDSDIDVLVIKSGNIHRRLLARKIYRDLFGLGKPVDIIVATPEDIKRSEASTAFFLDEAYKNGKVIYAQ